jgi:hypothetical protein
MMLLSVIIDLFKYILHMNIYKINNRTYIHQGLFLVIYIILSNF